MSAGEPRIPVGLTSDEIKCLAARRLDIAEGVNAILPLTWFAWFIVAPYLGTTPAYHALVTDAPAGFWLFTTPLLSLIQIVAVRCGGRRLRRSAAGLSSAFWLFAVFEIAKQSPGNFAIPTLLVAVIRCLWVYFRLRAPHR